MCDCELDTETNRQKDKDMEKEGVDHDAISFIPSKYFI